MSCDRAIIFDLDGTLIDSAPAIAVILNDMRLARNLAPLGADFYRRVISRGANELIRHSLEAAPEELVMLLDEFRERYRYSPVMDRPFPQVPSTLAALYRRGTRLGICSNKPLSLCQKILENLHLVSYFHGVVGGMPDRPAKPHRDPLDLIIRELNVKPHMALFVGDSIVDQQTASVCNVPFVFFASGYDDGVDRSCVARTIFVIDEILEIA